MSPEAPGGSVDETEPAGASPAPPTSATGWHPLQAGMGGISSRWVTKIKRAGIEICESIQQEKRGSFGSFGNKPSPSVKAHGLALVKAFKFLFLTRRRFLGLHTQSPIKFDSLSDGGPEPSKATLALPPRAPHILPEPENPTDEPTDESCPTYRNESAQ